MSGLMRRFTRGRAATDDEATPPATGTSEAAGNAADETRSAGGEPVPANGSVEPGTALTAAEPPAAEQPTRVIATEPGAGAEPAIGDATQAETEIPGRDLPAGVDLDELRDVPADSATRGKLRRRIGYLRQVRELLLRDLGGFYAEAHRSEQGPDAHRRLLDAKARRLTTLDAEVRELEARLSEPHAETVLRQPGIGGTCPECGELYGSGARYCSRCAAPLTGRAARGRAGAPTPQGTGTASRATPAAGTTGTGAGTGALGPATGAAAEEERMTTASLWGRRRAAAPLAPADETRAAELTEARPSDASNEAPADGGSTPATHGPDGTPGAEGGELTTSARPPESEPETRVDAAAGDQPASAEAPPEPREEHS
jgi:hypothetical protein